MADRDPTYQADCLFCRIAAGEIPSDRVFEDEKPREIGKVFPARQRDMLGRLARYADEAESDG